MDNQKPFSDVRRSRFEGTGKRAGGGSSLRCLLEYEDSRSDAEVEVDNSWSNEPYPENRRRLVSCVECEFDKAPATLNKDRAWEWLPALLEESAVGPPQAMTGRQRGKQVYRVEALMEQLELRRKERPGGPTHGEAQAKQRRRGQPRGGAIYQVSASKHKRTPSLFATPPTVCPK